MLAMYVQSKPVILVVQNIYEWTDLYHPVLMSLVGIRSPLSVHFFAPKDAEPGTPGVCRTQDNPLYDKNLGWCGSNGLLDGPDIQVLTQLPNASPKVKPLKNFTVNRDKKHSLQFLQAVSKDPAVPKHAATWMRNVLENPTGVHALHCMDAEWICSQ